jgi:hypothetical protein
VLLQGVFTSALLSAPLLFIMFLILVSLAGQIHDRWRTASCSDLPQVPTHDCCLTRWVLVVQINYLIGTSILLVRMKRKELLYRARQQHRQATAAGNGSGNGQAAAEGIAAVEEKKER